jgi:hypothetical protein
MHVRTASAKQRLDKNRTPNLPPKGIEKRSEFTMERWWRRGELNITKNTSKHGLYCDSTRLATPKSTPILLAVGPLTRSNKDPDKDD